MSFFQQLVPHLQGCHYCGLDNRKCGCGFYAPFGSIALELIGPTTLCIICSHPAAVHVPKDPPVFSATALVAPVHKGSIFADPKSDSVSAPNSGQPAAPSAFDPSGFAPTGAFMNSTDITAEFMSTEFLNQQFAMLATATPSAKSTGNTYNNATQNTLNTSCTPPATTTASQQEPKLCPDPGIAKSMAQARTRDISNQGPDDFRERLQNFQMKAFHPAAQKKGKKHQREPSPDAPSKKSRDDGVVFHFVLIEDYIFYIEQVSYTIQDRVNNTFQAASILPAPLSSLTWHLLEVTTILRKPKSQGSKRRGGAQPKMRKEEYLVPAVFPGGRVPDATVIAHYTNNTWVRGAGTGYKNLIYIALGPKLDDIPLPGWVDPMPYPAELNALMEDVDFYENLPKEDTEDDGDDEDSDSDAT
ncbi:hypothetical protein EDD85DRAFT_795145 [Armillaria nabsnona]|nr:hypothetical protein EDD85DRAFT_795145 [Armillaria nabsnona]